MRAKQIARIFIITVGICLGLFAFVGVPLLTGNWIVTAIFGAVIGVVVVVGGLVLLITWAFSP